MRVAALYDRFLKKAPRQERSRSAVEAILTATLEKLTRAGEGAVTIQAVAARAGVGVGSLYDYFRDRESILAAAVGKITQDNLDAFEAALDRTEGMPLRGAVESIVDFTLETYARDPHKHRGVLRITMALGLMPMLVRSQDRFAGALAAWLRRRDDICAEDVDHAAWLATHAMMGVANSMIWDDSPETSPTLPEVRGAAVEMITAFLGAR
jgi:AcrR family transcriptional regulator